MDFVMNGILLVIMPRLPILSSITIQGTFCPVLTLRVPQKELFLGLMVLRTAAIYGDQKNMKRLIYALWVVIPNIISFFASRF